MNHFLVVFDRKAGEVTRMETFTDGSEALRARFAYERAHDLGRDTEVVVLVSESEAALRHTHGRYFNRMKDLLETALLREDAPRPAEGKSGWWKAKAGRFTRRTA